MFKSSSGSTITEMWTFEAGGALATTFTTAACTGTASFTGGSWSATATTLTFDNKTETCTGAVTCSDSGPGGCTGLIPPVKETCDYALSNGDKTLTLSKCSGGGGSLVFTHS